MVVDFGATPVSGIHVQTVENLRKYYGLEYQPVRVVDPYQMLGEVDEKLAAILGADTVAARGRKNSFGIYNHGTLKEYLTPWGQTVLVPEWARGGPVIGFFCKQAQGLFNKRIETFFRRKISCIAGNTGPVKCGCIDRIVPRFTFHQGKLATHVIFNPL